MSHIQNDEGGIHFYSPKVASQIDQNFRQPQKIAELDLRSKLELLEQEQGRAIEYLHSSSYKKIVDLGKTRNTNLLMSEDDTMRGSRMRRNMINPKSLPRLKEERKGTLERDLSLKNIIREQLSTVKF